MGKTVVFGGAGFLGSHVVDQLQKKGFEVTVFDRQCPRKSNRMYYKYIEGDILDEHAVLEACKDCSYVYNFAGLADINEAKVKPVETVKSNILGNLNILEACRSLPIKRFVFASSVYVYSESGSFYRASKQSCEKFIELYAEEYALPYTILRYGSLYGRGADRRNTIFRFIDDALKKRKITYHGDGSELREYIHVLDAAEASVQILAGEYRDQHMVLTGNQMLQVKNIMQMINETLGGHIDFEFNRSEDHAHYKITPYSYRPKLGKKLLVNPHIDLGQGILDCIHEIDEENATLAGNASSSELHV